MALYEMRTYTLYVGKMAEAERLTRTHRDTVKRLGPRSGAAAAHEGLMHSVETLTLPPRCL